MNPALVPLLLVALIIVWATEEVDTAEIMLRGDHSVTQQRGALIVGDASVTLPADATLPGPVYVIGGELRIRGSVGGDVMQLGGSLVMEEGATIGGELLHIAGAQAISETAAIGRRTSIEEVVPAERHPINRYFPVAIVALALALIGGRRARKTPQTLTNVGNAIAHHPLISLTVGALVSVTFLSLFVFMAFTLILIPVSILGLLGGVVAIAYGVIVFGYLIGRRIDTQRVGPATAAGTILVMAALVLVGLIPLVGDLFVLGVAFTGLGAVVITYFGLKEFKPVALPE